MGFGMIGKFLGGAGEGVSKIGTEQMAQQALADRDARLNQYHQDAFKQITSAEQAKAKNQQDFDAMQKGLDRTSNEGIHKDNNATTLATNTANNKTSVSNNAANNSTVLQQTNLNNTSYEARVADGIAADKPYKNSVAAENTAQTEAIASQNKLQQGLINFRATETDLSKSQAERDSAKQMGDMTEKLIHPTTALDSKGTFQQDTQDENNAFNTKDGSSVPKIRPASGASEEPPKFVDGKVYTDAKGNKARYSNGKFEDIK